MLRQIISIYKNGRHVTNEMLDNYIQQLQAEEFDPNEVPKEEGETLLHSIVNKCFRDFKIPDQYDKKLLDVLLAAGAKPSTLNHEGKDLLDVLGDAIKYNLSQITFSNYLKDGAAYYDIKRLSNFFYSYLQNYNNPPLLAKLLHKLPYAFLPLNENNSSSLLILQTFSEIFAEKIKKLEKDISSLKSQAAEEHEWEKRYTYDRASAVEIELEDIKIKKREVDDKYFLVSNYGEFPDILIKILTQADPKWLKLRAMLSQGSLFFFMEKIHDDVQFNKYLDAKSKKIFTDFWNSYLKEKEHLDKLNAIIKPFTPAEDQQLADMLKTLSHAHPEHKIKQEALSSFQPAQTKMNYKNVLNQFKRYVQTNSNRFFNLDQTELKEEMRKKSYEAAMTRNGMRR